MDDLLKKLEIIPASIDDLTSISDVQKKSWLATYPNDEFGITKEDILAEDFYSDKRISARRKVLENQNSNTKFFVAKIDKKLIGYICAAKEVEYNKIRSIYILPEFERKGIGQKLMEKAVDYFNNDKPIKLTVAIYNNKAISFYEKLGFKKGQKLEQNPEGHFVSGHQIPEMEMMKY